MINYLGGVLAFSPLLIGAALERLIGETSSVRTMLLGFGVAYLVLDVACRLANVGSSKSSVWELLLTPAFRRTSYRSGSMGAGEGMVPITNVLADIGRGAEGLFESFGWGRRWLAGTNGGIVFCLPVWFWGAVLIPFAMTSKF